MCHDGAFTEYSVELAILGAIKGREWSVPDFVDLFFVPHFMPHSLYHTTTTSEFSLMDQAQDFKSLQDQVQAALISTTRTAGQISAEDLSFHRSFNPEVGSALDEQSERVLALASALLKSATSISELQAPSLEDADDVENSWRNVVDVVDSLLEKSDTCLDEYTGVIKRKDSSIEPSIQVGQSTLGE